MHSLCYDSIFSVNATVTMRGLKIFLVLLGFLLFAVPSSNGESSSCLRAYEEGGAAAVFESPECPYWHLSSFQRNTLNCQFSTLQGRRRYQEDRVSCDLDLQIPFPGRTGIKNITAGMVAIFDGHNGAEASDMASKLLLEYFILHTYFLLHGTYSSELKSTGDPLALDMERSSYMEILKESLRRTIHDIDATFSKANLYIYIYIYISFFLFVEASRNNLFSGSTATVALIVDGQIIVANVGDSKALLCSKGMLSLQEAKVEDYGDFKLEASNGSTHFSARELTRDHHPDRDDERSRVEAAGGFVVEWAGAARVNGELAVSRAIGDMPYKRYGVISTPEMTDWQPPTGNDSYLVAASDGIFHKLTTQDVCDLLWYVHTRGNEKSELSASCSHSLADCIVNTAFEEGSTDNLSAVVVPLRSTGFSGALFKERFDGEGSIDSSAFGLQKIISSQSGNLPYSLDSRYNIQALVDIVCVPTLIRES
ncbi:hypothetical protein HHK36_026778 [Tetracentron sinense]|uniref:PPM-type phosphatase domain-containing protein n=1 Tax=Tetracentron sinense TaxID=13715 RepID=A0A835D4X7_TETSI|nr:hypothetical protein HHK36_026778 [Tetracentron sinense]